MRKIFLLIGLMGLVGLIFLGLIGSPSIQSSHKERLEVKNGEVFIQKGSFNDGVVKSRVLSSYGKLPLYFIRHEGQIDKNVLFYAKAKSYTLWMTKEGLVFDSVITEKKELSKEPSTFNPDKYKRDVSRLIFLNSNPKTFVTSLDITEYKVNYFIGNDSSKWITDIPTSKAILYKELYSNIDIKVYGVENQIEYDWILKPKGRVEDIQFEYRDVKKVKKNKDGDLIVKTDFGELRHKKPIAYQIINGKRVEVDVEFKNISKYRFGFKAADFNKKHSLIIDPVLSYSTYLGGSAWDYGRGIAVDSSGCAYVTGTTSSADFPTQNPFQGTIAGGYDVFVTKLSSSGNSLIYSTFLGGSGYYNDVGRGIAVDSSGCAYVTGSTGSLDFPTQNPFQRIGRGRTTAFITKLSSSGNSLIYSTFLGGDSNAGSGIAVDSSGCAYVTGWTAGDLPTQNPFQGTWEGGYYSAFVTKLSSSGNSLIYSTFLGGSAGEDGRGIAVDSSGCAYVTGWTPSTNFPTQNPFQETHGGAWHGYGYDAFVTKLSSSGNSLIYSTYLGGGTDDLGYGIAVDSSGCAYVTGRTRWDFPTQNPFQGTSCGGYEDAFVTKLSSSGNSLIYSSYLGGCWGDYGYGIAVDSSGCAYVTGDAFSADFPTQNPYQTHQGQDDAFIAKIVDYISDAVPPTTTVSKTPSPNAAGWNNADVIVTLSAADNEGGSGVKEIKYSLTGATDAPITAIQGSSAQITITAEGTTTVNYWAVDNAGNEEASNSLQVKIDKTPPNISGSRDPLPNTDGWNNTSVTVLFNASDTGGSGIDMVTPDKVVSQEGQNQSVTGTATDKAGNSNSCTVAGINIDKTPPIISGSITPAPNPAGWNNSNATVSFSASDNLSGVASKTPDQVISSEGPRQIISGEAMDKAGNKATTQVTVNIDKSSPTVSITANPNVLWPPNQKMIDVKISGSAIDGISGIASLTFKVKDEYGKVEPAISSFGSSIQLEAWRNGDDRDGRLYIITVTIKDNAGNESTASTTVLVPHDQGK